MKVGKLIIGLVVLAGFAMVSIIGCGGDVNGSPKSAVQGLLDATKSKNKDAALKCLSPKSRDKAGKEEIKDNDAKETEDITVGDTKEIGADRAIVWLSKKGQKLPMPCIKIDGKWYVTMEQSEISKEQTEEIMKAMMEKK